MRAHRWLSTLLLGSLVLLLCGGDKRTQNADIERAVELLTDFKRRSK